MAKKAKSIMFSSFSSKSLISLSSFTSLPASPLNQTFSQSIVEETLEAAESIIKKWDPNSQKIVSLFSHSRKDAKEFIRCVRDLRRAMHFLVSQHLQSPKLVLAQTLMQLGMARLEIEFFQILSSNRDQLNHESVSAQSTVSSNSEFENVMESESDDDEDDELKKAGESITQVEKASALVMSDLKVIAETMISCGYGKECINSYKLIRKSIVDEGLHLLGIEKCKISRSNRLHWSVLEIMIKKWIKAAKIGVVTLFRGEKLLCDHVFSASSNIRESCFYEIANEAGINLFKLPELVVAHKEKKSSPPERIFKLLDLYTAIADLWPDIELIFHFDSTAAVKTLAHSSLKKLRDLIHTSLKEFESTIQKDSSKALTSEGGIHNLTRSSMSFISSLSEYSSVLSEILAEHPLKRNTRLLESYFTAPILEDELNNHIISVQLAWLILVVLCKLDIKAESYNDVSLSYHFLMNNIQFMIDTVRSTHLKNLLGDDWLTKHDKKLRSYAANYEIAAWSNVLLSLPEKTNTTLSPEEAKTHFKRFHVAFEEAYKKQSSCVIPNAKLRDEIKISLSKKLVPEYREFYKKYLTTLSEDRNIEILLKFSPDNLENYLSDLFQGTHTSSSLSSSS